MNPVDSLSDDELAHLVERAIALPDAPAALVRAVVARFPAVVPPAALKDVARAAWRLVAATLSFDSWSAPQVAWGVRGSVSDTRHLLYSARGHDIDLRIGPGSLHYSVSGQVLGPEASGSVELVGDAPRAGGDACTLAAALDPLGEFRLDGVREGTYRMTLRMGGDEIVLPPIVVGSQAR